MVQFRGALTTLVTVFCMCSGSAWAQSFNVNFAPVEDFPGPASTYAGAGLAGVWNQYVDNFEEPLAIVDTDGNAGSATVTLFNAGNRSLGGDILGAGGSADDAALLFGKFNSFIGSGGIVRFNGLTEGVYEVTTYAWSSDVTFMQGSLVDVVGSTEGQLACGGAFTGAHQEGVTYVRHTVTTLSGEVEIHINENSFGAALNGVQLRRTGSALTGVRAGSLNVDFGASMGSPPSSYGAVGMAGVWNSVTNAPGVVPIVGLDGNPTDTTMTLEGGSSFNTIFSFPNDFHALQFDFWALADGVPFPSQNIMRFANLEPGSYRVLTYCTYGGPTGATVSVAVSGSADPVQHVGDQPAEEHSLGITYAEHNATVGEDGTLEITVTRDNYAGGVSGVQLVASTAPPCTADFNGVNGVTVQDIFDFLTAWLAGSSTADFNHVNGVTVQDIFDFLTAWLAGC